jgi:hypothetical protein
MRILGSIAFTSRLRIGMGESLLALQMAIISRLRLVRWNCKSAAADSAARKGRHGRNGSLSVFC